MYSPLFVMVYCLIMLFKYLSARHYRRGFSRAKSCISYSDATLMQPILSGDPSLKSTLAANISSLTDVNFLLLVDDDDLEAHRISLDLQHEFSGAKITVLSYGTAPDGINPKAFKLAQALSQVNTRYCVVLDDDTRLPAETLTEMLDKLSSSQMVTGLPYYAPGRNWPSRLLAGFVNDNSAFTYLSTLTFQAPLSINGMGYAFERDWMVSTQGFSQIESCLTDDLAIAEHVQRCGGRLCQLPLTMEVSTDVSSFSSYSRQMHRWFVFATLLFQQQNLQVRLQIILLHTLPALLLWLSIVLFMVTPNILSGLALISGLSARALLLHIGRANKVRFSLAEALLSVSSELLQPLHLIHAVFNRTIRWRSRRYRVIQNDNFVKVR